LKRATWAEVDNLRRLVDAATDACLVEYAKSMRATYGQVARGYGRSSAGFADCGGLSDFDDLAHEVDRRISSVATTIIYSSVPYQHRMAINAVYLCGIWGEDEPLDLALLEAVSVFEKYARAKGLL
jgi:hypothetical protein